MKQTGANGGVIPIPLGFVSVFLLPGRRSILVDSGTPGSAGKILRALSRYGVKPGDVSLILITHGHGDHIGSAADLREATGAPIAVHRLDAGPCRTGVNPPLHPVTVAGRIASLFVPLVNRGGHRSFEPDVLIDGEMALDRYGVEGRVVPTPGHTPGSLSILASDGSIIVGDLLSGGMIRRRAPGLPLFASDLDQVRQSIRFVVGLSPKRIYCSHGGPLDVVAVRQRFG